MGFLMPTLPGSRILIFLTITDHGSRIPDPTTAPKEDPRTGIREPGSENRDPRTGIREPGSENRDPRTGIRDPGSGKTYSGSRIQGQHCHPGFRIRNVLVRISGSSFLRWLSRCKSKYFYYVDKSFLREISLLFLKYIY